jgi:hypothetical protein
MSKINWKLIGGLVAIAAVIAVVGVMFWQIAPYSSHARAIVETKTENGVTVSKFPDGTQEISASDGGYAVAVPSGWYIESPASSGVTVYPDYTPENSSKISSSMPRCKIELYVSSNADSVSLENWIARALREDPTVAVKQTATEATTVGGMPAIRWSGLENDIPTINTYVSAGTKIYEIVPSSLSPENLSVAPCMDYSDTFINSLKFPK